MGRTIVAGGKRGMTAPPKPGIQLSTIAEGSVVKLMENGTATEFVVLKHEYEYTTNTLLMRKTLLDNRAWGSGSSNEYPGSDIAKYLEIDYRALFDADTQAAFGTAMVPVYNTVSGNVTYSRMAVFLLSLTEVGLDSPDASIEGSAIPYFSDNSKRIAYNSAGTAAGWWLRSLTTYSSNTVWYVLANGGVHIHTSSYADWGVRPVLLCLNTALFDPDTLIFKGVA